MFIVMVEGNHGHEVSVEPLRTSDSFSLNSFRLIVAEIFTLKLDTVGIGLSDMKAAIGERLHAPHKLISHNIR